MMMCNTYTPVGLYTGIRAVILRYWYIVSNKYAGQCIRENRGVRGDRDTALRFVGSVRIALIHKIYFDMSI